MLDSAMNSLHIRLPGDALTTAKAITAYPLKSETDTIQKSIPTSSVEINTNFVGPVNDALNSASSVTKVEAVELRIRGGKVEKIEINNNNNNNDNISDKQIKCNLNNNEVENRMESDDKKGTAEKQVTSRVNHDISNPKKLTNTSDTKSKLKLIDVGGLPSLATSAGGTSKRITFDGRGSSTSHLRAWAGASHPSGFLAKPIGQWPARICSL